MKEFILTYWKQILDVLSILFCITFFLIKKKPVKVIDSVVTYITSNAVEVINCVEHMANGSKYIEYHGVITPKIDVAIDLMKEKIKLFIPNADVNLYSYFIRKVIEDILSTPQKKGE